MRFKSITQRFMFWFVMITLLPILLIGYGLLHTFEQELRHTVAGQISVIADKKVDQIDGYLGELARDALIKTQGYTTRLALGQFTRVFARDGVKSAAYRRLDASHHDYFKRFLGSAGYYDLFLISAQGTVVYSYKHEADFATNLFTGPYRNTGLAKVTRNALSTLESGISEFELYAPSGNAIAAFIAMPVMTEGRVDGVLALQIDNTRLFQELLDNTGLGESGETVVVRLQDERNALVVTPLKNEPDAALKRKIPLDNLDRGEPLIHALNGERGSGFETDYNGVPVVAAWRYLPRMGWGMVVKMDTAEALAPLYRVRSLALAVMSLALLAALTGALLLGRRVVDPLKDLIKGAQDIAAGKLDQRVPVTRADELGQLAISFNAMAERLQSMYTSLEGQVEQRTADVKKSEELLASMIDNMPTMVFVKRASDLRFDKLNHAGELLLGIAEQELLGKNDYDFFPREQAEFFTGNDREVLASHAMKDIPQETILTRNGETRILHTRKIGIYNAAGEATHLLGMSIDITEQINAENALQRERDFASGLLETAPMIVLLLDTSGNIEYINPYFEQLGGYRLDEVKGRDWFSIFLPEREQENIRALFLNAAQGVPTRGNINPIVTRSGAELEIEWNDQAMRDAQGKIVSVLATGHDVTARRAMERVLSASAERLNEAQRLAKVGSWELNLLTGELVWSDEVFRLFEIDKNKFGATYEAFLNAIHPEDRDKVNLAYTESLKTRKPYEVTHRLLMSDGRIKWVQESCESEFAGDGKPLFSRGTVQDISPQKYAEQALAQSEALYRALAQLAPVGIFRTDASGASIYVNDHYCEISGISREAALGKGWAAALHPDDRARVQEEWLQAVKQRHPFASELRLRRPDGQVIWIESHAKAETDSSGEVIGYVGTVTDITARKHAEVLLRDSNEELERRVQLRTDMLRAAKEEAEQANKSKSVFLTSMSHELRTPLNAILGYAQLMQLDPGLPQNVVENAAEIKRAGDYLLNLMSDILDLARIESGKLHLQPETLSLAVAMNNCHAHNIQAAISRNVALHMAESCSAYQVVADQRGLMQVLNNLVSNAIKYNRAGGRVNVSCTEGKPGAKGKPGTVRIAVTDNGMGIAADKQAQLFQPFNRLGAERGSIEGTGIGLVISRKLVEGMQGVIGMESVYGVGSTFWVELPVAKNAADVKMYASNMIGGLPAAAAPGQATAEAQRAPHILVAEDYAPNQNVLLLQLQTMGCEVDIAADGAAALKMWRKKPYDLILTDIDMPVMNGLEFAQAVRNEERSKGGRIPMMAITATSSTAELKRFQAAGIDEVLSKPLSMEVLRAGLARWFGYTAATPSRLHAREAAPSAGSSVSHAPLDLNYLYSILGQVNLVQARILLDTFMRTADEGLQALSTQMDNAAAVAKEMHKQKSSARTVGALHYANLAATLEKQTRDENFGGVAAALAALREALEQVEAASANLLESPRTPGAVAASEASLTSVSCHSALVVDDDLVVLQQVRTMLDALGVTEVLTATNGLEASRVLAARGGEIEVLVCDLSMPEMDGVELIRGFGKTGFKGGLILISGADEKIISTVNKLAVLQGVRVLGQLQKPVSAAQLAGLLAHTEDLPAEARQVAAGPVVSSEAIRAAMAANEFSIWFQPKVDAASLRAVGIEALARWQLPSGKFISPDNFITVAEREGLIGELSRLLVDISLIEAAKLFAAGFPLKVAINLSGTWLNDLSLPDFILSRTSAVGLRAEDVILEVTETGVMEDLTTALDVLSRLRLKGFGLSIDDFGIGYSSFEQLGRIPFTEMKLDRSFVCKGVEDAAARAILESSMDMAHKLKLATVAEGVETELDLKLVRSLGCDLVQGYLIAKPMPVKDLIVWLGKEKSN